MLSLLVPIGIIIGVYINDPNSFSILELVLIIISIAITSSFIFLFKLSTRIDETGIHYKFFPFHWKYKIIRWNSIDKAYIRTYDAISEYGGWGLKGSVLWKKSKGKAINVSGDIGIQLELKNNKKILIGTKKEAEAKSVLNTYIKKH